MNETHVAPEGQDEPGLYQVRLKGHLNDRWADWFGDVTLTLEDNGITILTCPLMDQAALHGLLKRVRDLGIPLLSVNCVQPGRAKTKEVKS